MKLYRKLLLFTIAAAVVPLSVVGFTLLRSAERALSERIAREQVATADATAEAVGAQMEALLQQVTETVSSWNIAEMNDAELRSLMLVLYRRAPAIDAVSLTDADGGPVVPALFAAEEPPEGSPLAGHAQVTRAGLNGYFAQLPLKQAAQVESALVLSPAWVGAEGRTEVALALPVRGRGGATWIVGVLANLEQIRSRVASAGGSAGAAVVLDEDARVVVGPGVAAGARAPRQDAEVATRLRASSGGTAAYEGQGRVPYLAAFALVPGGAGWGVFMRLPAAQAFAEVGRMRRTVLFWTLASLAGFVLLGWIFIRGVTRGLGAIEGAARELGKGNLAHRVPESVAKGRDELGGVARTFNAMGEELSAARVRLERWNEDLKAKVEERTRELKDAQAQLLEAQKLAAIGQLGAGVAHEINNPLAGILGHAQLLLLKKKPEDADYGALKKMEELAKRCREITTNLLRFSQQRQEPDFQEIDLNKVVQETLSISEGQLKDGGVTLGLALADALPPVKGDAGHLAQVMLNLLANAHTACRGKAAARIEVGTRAGDGLVQVWVRDTGKGIAPDVLPRIFEPFFTTKDVWSNVGLGLSVSYRIVSEHGGKIAVESRPGEGSTFTVALPAAGEALRATA